MDRWTEIELFVETARQGKLSRAAETLGLSNAAASRHLASLEQRLNARLIQRSTRSLTLTEVGEQFYRSCQRALAEMREGELAANASATSPSGCLKVSASVSFAVKHIAPLVREYTARYPDVTIHVETSNRYLDVIDNGIDVAIRTREFENDSNITVRRLAETRRVLAASPEYLIRHGVPATVEDLPNHRLLLYTHSRSPNELLFSRGSESRTIHVRGYLGSNEGQVLRTAALDGLGILVQPRYIVQDDLNSGKLLPVLDDWDLPRLRVNVAFQNRRLMSAKVRTFVDFLIEHFESRNYEHQWTGPSRSAGAGIDGLYTGSPEARSATRMIAA